MMNYTTMNIGNKEYKLNLDIRAMCEAEKRLGNNPINVLLGMKTEGNLPSTDFIVIMLHAALQKYNHGIKFEDTYDLLQKYLDEGYQYVDLLNLVAEVFTVSGIIKEDENKEENPN